MAKRKNTFTRFVEDIVDDTKDFVDDILDRAKDLETDMKDAVKDAVDDDESDSVSASSLSSLESALAELAVKVNQLAEMQLAGPTATPRGFYARPVRTDRRRGGQQMETQVDEIAGGVYRLSTFTDAVAGGFTFNQFLMVGDDALLFHTGPRQMFPLVSTAVAKVIRLEQLRWVSFGHWEADESGALNEWLEAAPNAEVAVGTLGTLISGTDQAIRPPRPPLTDGEVLDLGGKRVRWIDTPHVPHGWDAGLMYEETTSTLLCGDIGSHTGSVPALTENDVVGPASAAEDMFGATCLTAATAPTIRRLAGLAPRTLGIMHGASFTGDCAATLHGMADDYERRFRASLEAAR